MANGLDAVINRQPASAWERFTASPLKFSAQALYDRRARTSTKRLSTSRTSNSIRVVCIADTHTMQPIVPDGDLLIHAGDLTEFGTVAELQRTISWLSSLPHLHKVVIAGNHDVGLRDHPDEVSWGNDLVYLENRSITLSIRGRTIKVHGSPCTPGPGSGAFIYPRHLDIWSETEGVVGRSTLDASSNEAEGSCTLPNEIDILITHGPPRYHLELNEGGQAGCHHLLSALHRIHPLLHVFGHIHVGHGVEVLHYDKFQKQYESIRAGEGGWLQALGMAWQAVFGGHESPANRSILVNAAIKRGNHNVYDPIAVEI